MTNKILLKDGRGSKKVSGVDSYNALITSNQLPEILPIGTANRATLFSGYLGLTGISTTKVIQSGIGTLATPIKYYVQAHKDYDIFIERVTFLHTWNKNNYQWGELGVALPNGYLINSIERGVTTPLVEATTSGGMFIHTGTGSKGAELKKWTATQDAAIMEMNIFELIPSGLRLGRGTTSRLEAVVQDNMSTQIDQFVFVLGHKHYP